MFWEIGYTASQNIEALLQKEDVKLEELLDDEDILQECKTQKRNLVQFLTRPDILKKLIELITTEPPDDLSTAQRFKYSNTACEILTFGLPSLDERLVEEPTILQTLYSFLEQEPPLNPLLSSFFSKTFSKLISKKSEQDWFLYQKMCLQVLEFIKSRGNFLDLILKHFDIPVIMDLLIQIIKEVQGGALKKDLYEWLTEQQLVERLIRMLGAPEEPEKHNNIAEFLCDMIKHGRSMRQTEQENDSFEPTFIGSNPLLQVIESESSISLLLDQILQENTRESSVVSGILVVLTLVDESIADEPASDKALQLIISKEKENYERIVSTVIRAISPRIKDFQELLVNPPIKKYAVTNVTQVTPPFGFTRLQICRLFTVLLRTGNKDIINTVCETDFFNTLLNLFKQYSWNNFLHSEVEKCFEYVFATFDQNENEEGFNMNPYPSALQIHVIVNCNIVSKLIECWMHNKEVQSSKNGRRLGYMGHLIQILKHVTWCIAKSYHIRALIEENLNEKELENWKFISDAQTGELSNELDTQMKLLADCDPHQEPVLDDGISLPKDFQNETYNSEYYNDSEAGLSDNLDDQIASGNETALDKLCEYIGSDNGIINTLDEISMDLQRNLKVWGSLDDNNDEEIMKTLGNVSKPETNALNMTVNPWGVDPFTDIASIDGTSGWADFSSYNFADFDTHFNSFSSDLGDKSCFDSCQSGSGVVFEKSDKNANVEKISIENADNFELSLKNAKNLDLNSENCNAHTITRNEVEDNNTFEYNTNTTTNSECYNSGERERECCMANDGEDLPNCITKSNNDSLVLSNGPTKDNSCENKPMEMHLQDLSNKSSQESNQNENSDEALSTALENGPV